MRYRRLGAVAAAATAAVLWWRLRPSTPNTVPVAAPVAEPRAVARLAAWTPSPPTSPVARALAYLWAAPLSAAGLLLGAASGTAPHVCDGVVRFDEARGVAGRMLRWRGFAAATLGHVIIAAGTPGDRLLRHELVHVRQAERWGPLFVPLYLAGLVRYGYRNNPFERAAYAAAERSSAA